MLKLIYDTVKLLYSILWLTQIQNISLEWYTEQVSGCGFFKQTRTDVEYNYAMYSRGFKIKNCLRMPKNAK
jgi:hypothetical protein